MEKVPQIKELGRVCTPKEGKTWREAIVPELDEFEQVAAGRLGDSRVLMSYTQFIKAHLLDIWPTREELEVRPPDDSEAYQQVLSTIDIEQSTGRLIHFIKPLEGWEINVMSLRLGILRCGDSLPISPEETAALLKLPLEEVRTIETSMRTKLVSSEATYQDPPQWVRDVLNQTRLV